MPVLISAVNFWRELYLLFADFTVIGLICLILGVALIVIEIFQPAYKIFAGLGSGLVAAGVVIRIVGGGSYAMTFIMVLIAAVIIVSAFLIMVKATKTGWLSRPTETAAPDSPAAPEAVLGGAGADYYYLLSMEGVATTALKPGGKMNIGGELFEVSTKGVYVERGRRVKVTEVEGNCIYVREIR